MSELAVAAPSQSLPIVMDDGIKLDTKAARAYGQTMHEAYANARPYPHAVIDNFLPDALISKIVANFPRRSVEDEEIFQLGHIGHHKRQIPPANCDGFNRELFNFFNSAPILRFLEGISGIKGLLSDPYFSGGGFHEISRGGMLGIHADFRLNKPLNLHRRLNMLIYLNSDWKEEWGGQLEIWDRGMTHKVVGVSPLVNRCVIFNTDADSYHGHPDALNCPEKVTRKSIALYYYTASDSILSEIPDQPTVYVDRPDEQAHHAKSPLSLKFEKLMGGIMPPLLSRAIFRMRLKLRAERSQGCGK